MSICPFEHKFYQKQKEQIKGNIDLIISETKIDDNFFTVILD